MGCHLKAGGCQQPFSVTATKKHLISEKFVGGFWLASYRLVQPDEREACGRSLHDARWRTVFPMFD